MITTQPVSYEKSFQQIVNEFPQKLAEFNPVEKAFPVTEVFGPGKGRSTSLKLLQAKGIITKPDDFKGLYVLLKGNEPFYVGISRKVVQRIQQHVKGGSHFSASLAYKIGLTLHKRDNGIDFSGQRNDLDLAFIKEVQQELLQQRIAIYPIDCDNELYLFEVYCSMELGTPYNDFRTH